LEVLTRSFHLRNENETFSDPLDVSGFYVTGNLHFKTPKIYGYNDDLSRQIIFLDRWSF